MAGTTNKLTSSGDFLNNVGQNALDGVAGIFANKMLAKYSSGARAILRINGQIVGFAFGIQWSIQTSQRELYTIDDWLPAELIPGPVSVTGSISALHIPGESATKREYQGSILSHPMHKYITIEVRDSQTDALLFFTNKAAITNKTEVIGAEELSKVTLQFKSIGWLDEKQPTQPVQRSTSAPGNSRLKIGLKLGGEFPNLPF